MLWHQQRRIESGDSQPSVQREATVRQLEVILQNELNGSKNLLDISFGLKNDEDNSV